MKLMHGELVCECGSPLQGEEEVGSGRCAGCLASRYYPEREVEEMRLRHEGSRPHSPPLSQERERGTEG